MYHEIKIRDKGDGWFEILERSTPTSPFTVVATVWGERRASQVKELFSSPLANAIASAEPVAAGDHIDYSEPIEIAKPQPEPDEELWRGDRPADWPHEDGPDWPCA